MSQSVKAIPPGYHTITPNITVKDAAKAIEFYKSAFGAQEIMRMPGPGGRIMHAEMTIGDSKFMIADEMPEMGNKGPKSIGGSPVSFYLYFENVLAQHIKDLTPSDMKAGQEAFLAKMQGAHR